MGGNRRFSPARATCALLLAAAVDGAPPASAQQTTALRFDEPARGVPASLTVLTQRQLDRRGVESLEQLQRQVPSLVAGGSLPGFTLRGIGGRVVGPASEPGFAVRQGGVVASRIDIADMGFFDLERLEIARGPQGALYGRNTAGGILNLLARRPDPRFAADLDFEYGSGGSRLRAVLNAPLPDDHSALRVAVQHRERDAFYKLFAGPRRALNRDDTALRAALSSHLSDTLRFDFSWTYWRTDAGDSPPALLDARGSERTLDLALDRSVNFGTAALAWRVADFLLTLRGGYQSHDTSQTAGWEREPDANATSRARVFDDVRAWSCDLEILFEDGGPFRFAFGAGYFDENNEGSGADFEASAPDAEPTAGARRFATAVNRTVDTFADGSYQMLERLRIRGGIHLNYTHRHFDGRSTAAALPEDTDTGFSDSATWSSITWRAGLDLDLTPDQLVYALVSTGNRPGGFDLLDRDSYKEEEVLAVELGGKSSFFADRLRGNLAGFRYDYTDIQARAATPASGRQTVANIPAAEIYGVEVGWLAEPLDRLLLNGTFGWLKTRYSEAFTIESAPDSTSPTAPSSPVNLKGRKLSHSPATSLNLGAQYTCEIERLALPELLRGALTARFDYTHRATVYFDTALEHRQGPWDSADLRVLYDKTFATFAFTVEGFVSNLWNERVETNAVAIGARAPHLAFYNNPRTYGFRLTARWR